MTPHCAHAVGASVCPVKPYFDKVNSNRYGNPLRPGTAGPELSFLFSNQRKIGLSIVRRAENRHGIRSRSAVYHVRIRRY